MANVYNDHAHILNIGNQSIGSKEIDRRHSRSQPGISARLVVFENLLQKTAFDSLEETGGLVQYHQRRPFSKVIYQRERERESSFIANYVFEYYNVV